METGLLLILAVAIAAGIVAAWHFQKNISRIEDIMNSDAFNINAFIHKVDVLERRVGWLEGETKLP